MKITLELSTLELHCLEFAIKDEIQRYIDLIDDTGEEIDTQMKLDASRSVDLKIYNALKDTDQLEKYEEESKNEVWLEDVEMPTKTFSVQVHHKQDGFMSIMARTVDEARTIAQKSLDWNGFDNSDIKGISDNYTTVDILEEGSIPK